jgi:type 1 fimbria pilin
MKKGLMTLVASAVVCSVAFASPTANEPSFTGLNVTEHAALFGEGSTVQAVALDSVEMKSTNGKALTRTQILAQAGRQAITTIRSGYTPTLSSSYIRIK